MPARQTKRAESAWSGLIESHVLEIQWLAVDPAYRRRDPIGEFPGFDHAPRHQRLHELVILRTGHPFILIVFPGFFRQNFAIGADEMPGEIADRAVESLVRQ